MTTIDLLKQSGTQMLGARPAARQLKPAIREAVEDGAITLDTSGVRRIGVSFFDESLLILKELMAETGDANLRLVYRKAPSLESLKNLIPHRGLTVVESSDGDWVISAPK